MIDLHIHSTVSDGSLTPKEIVRDAISKQMTMIAITDHDIYMDWSKLSDDTITVIGGMEISAFDYTLNRKAHLLVYGNNLTLYAINDVIRTTLSDRHRNSLRQLRILMDLGYPLSISQVATSDTGIMYKQHIMEQLVELGIASEMYDQTYQRLFKNPGPCAGDIIYPDVHDVIRAARRDNVLIVLAHPGLSGVFAEVPSYVASGLNGIETYHSLATAEHQSIAHTIALRHHLLETTGSDFHGRYGIEPDIGFSHLTAAEDAKLSKKFLNALNSFNR